ncbi:metallophosphoesterase family protein [Chachezhania sediminis]|uniref:metallophosphoesterase family protein n=1 Tax=Chachezhania sediminis TaxID=2599291 RepID=UPI00131CA58B|nr:metallophosphoesterase family protein [Chachezhania sediminis]
MSDPVYVIGDVHGHLSQVERALALIEADGGPEAKVIFLGDLVDRGPDSRRVLELLMAEQAAGRPWTVLKGNHDDMLVDYLANGTEFDHRISIELSWLDPRLGGASTLASYGMTGLERRTFTHIWEEARERVPQAHREYLAGLPLTEERDDVLFVHAGIRPGVDLAEQHVDDLMWIRKPFLDDPRDHPWLVVHGHTALDEPTHFGNRVDLDGGAGYGRTLHPVVFEGRESWLLTPTGRKPLARG